MPRTTNIRYTLQEAKEKLARAGFVYIEDTENIVTYREGSGPEESYSIRMYVRNSDRVKCVLWWFWDDEAYIFRRVHRDERL